MKKILLVTVLAVAASWAVRELRQSSGDPRASLVASKARHGDHRPSRVIVLDDLADLGDLADPIRPLKPVEPARPRSIRTVPWNPGKAGRDAQAKAKANVTAKADAIPSWFPKSEVEEETLAKPDASGSRVLVGRLSASEDRARLDLQKLVEREVSDWLAADVPPSWKVSAPLLETMVDGSYTQEVARNLIPTAPQSEATSAPEIPGLDGLYTLYRAGQKLDFSTERRAGIVAEYHRELATQRMQRLGGGLALVMVGLAVLSGYIRADEATKGYYTNALRLIALAGLGASGFAAYRVFV